MVEELRRGRLRRALARIRTPEEELDAADAQAATTSLGCEPIARCDDRELVTVQGTLRSVTLRPRAGVPALEAELWDGSGDLALVWLGRRRIAGVVPGRRVIAHGRVSTAGGRRVIYNPRYELQPAAHA